MERGNREVLKTWPPLLLKGQHSLEGRHKKRKISLATYDSCVVRRKAGFYNPGGIGKAGDVRGRRGLIRARGSWSEGRLLDKLTEKKKREKEKDK